MLNNIKGIKFKGAAFDSETTLQLFSPNEADRASLIFGRNGSGKSTISRAVSKLIENKEVEDIISARFVDSSNSDITITDDEKEHIFVFNEDYANSKVRFKEDGLSTIVMFGEIGDISDKIESAKKALKKAEKDYTEQNEKYSPYNDLKNIQSPESQYERIKARLKGNDSWADRERGILSLKANAAVTDTIIFETMETTPLKSQSEVLSAYKTKKTELQAAKSAGSKISTPIPTVNDYSDKTKTITNLLALKIEEPTLTDRDKKLLILAQGGKQSRLTEIKTEFSSETEICPFCLQPVTNEHKGELLKGIEKVLSRATEEHKAALEENRIPPISLELSIFEPVDKEATENCSAAIDAANTQIAKCNKAIEEKILNLYTPIPGFVSRLKESVDNLETQLSELDIKKNEYNHRIDNIQKIQEDLKCLNKKLAYYEIKDLYADYIKQKYEKDRIKEKLNAAAIALEKAREEIDALNQQKKNIKIAVDFINRGLQYVFFSEDRLRVKVSDDNYMLLSNNKPVKPKNISAGERNILALCYFFTELLNNVDEKDVYKMECLIVIDDPVSSFDLENRVGIISYLKSQIIKVLRGNQNSKIILFSHDLLTIYDLDKALEEVAKQIKIKINGNDKKMAYRSLELDKLKLTDLSCKKRNEYSQLLKTTYEYAANKSDEYELVIGNIMRRLLEAFGTFEYRKGIGEISCDQAILSIIPEEKRDYFESLMYRLILNGESHLEERTKSLTDNNFFATITADEKRRTAKDILCLMYLLNNNHIKAQFHVMKDEVGEDIIKNIENWVSAIPIAQSSEVSV